MATFYDDFERANGAPGGNWVNNVSTATITSGALSGASLWMTYNTSVSGATRQEAWGRFYYIDANSAYNRIVCKAGASTTYGYWAGFRLTTGVWYLVLAKGSYTVGVELAATALSGPPSTIHKLHVVWDNGHAIATYNDTVTAEADDAQYSAGTYGGVAGYAASTRCAEMASIGGAAIGLVAAPSVVGNYGACVTVVLTGTNTAWTAGTPGTPTFTLDHGTISAQTVDSATQATLTYCPGNFLGTVTFTDPSTGGTAGVVVTSDPAVLPPSGYGLLTAAGAASINEPAALFSGTKVLGDLTTFIPAADPWPTSGIPLLTGLQEMYAVVVLQQAVVPGVPMAFDKLWELINGAEAYVEGQDLNSLLTLTKADADGIWAFLKLTDPTYATIDDVVGALAGSPTTYSHADLKTAIDLISTGSNADVLDALAAYFGSSPPTIEQLGTMISDLATVAGYTLGNVLDAIAAIPGTDLSAITSKLTAIQPSTAFTLTTLDTDLGNVRSNVLDAIAAIPGTDLSAITSKLTAIQPSTSFTLTTLDTDLGNLAADLTATKNNVAAIRTGSNYTLASVMDAIAAIEIPPSAGGGIGPPVWPGADLVTLGSSVSLVDQLHLTAAMDGVLVAVTTPPTRVGQYAIGGAILDYGVGRIAFETDSGDLEPWQYLGFRSALYTPKTMAHAAGVRLQVLGGAAGTVTPWTVS